MTTSIMLDLETLATSPDSAILTFGAIKFNEFSIGDIGKPLYFKLDVNEQLAIGRKVDNDTLNWWARQDNAIKEEAFSEEGRISLDLFTKELNKFVVGVDRIWAQGPVFDIVILENLYRQIGKPAPWAFYQIRDSRTFLKALGDSRKKALLHNALADCISQAEAIQDAVSRYHLTDL